MLLIFDISTWIENECLKIETALPSILVLSINAGLKLFKVMTNMTNYLQETKS